MLTDENSAETAKGTLALRGFFHVQRQKMLGQSSDTDTQTDTETGVDETPITPINIGAVLAPEPNATISEPNATLEKKDVTIPSTEATVERVVENETGTTEADAVSPSSEAKEIPSLETETKEATKGAILADETVTTEKNTSGETPTVELEQVALDSSLEKKLSPLIQFIIGKISEANTLLEILTSLSSEGEYTEERKDLLMSPITKNKDGEEITLGKFIKNLSDIIESTTSVELKEVQNSVQSTVPFSLNLLTKEGEHFSHEFGISVSEMIHNKAEESDHIDTVFENLPQEITPETGVKSILLAKIAWSFEKQSLMLATSYLEEEIKALDPKEIAKKKSEKILTAEAEAQKQEEDLMRTGTPEEVAMAMSQGRVDIREGVTSLILRALKNSIKAYDKDQNETQNPGRDFIHNLIQRHPSYAINGSLSDQVKDHIIKVIDGQFSSLLKEHRKEVAEKNEVTRSMNAIRALNRMKRHIDEVLKKRLSETTDTAVITLLENTDHISLRYKAIPQTKKTKLSLALLGACFAKSGTSLLLASFSFAIKEDKRMNALTFLQKVYIDKENELRTEKQKRDSVVAVPMVIKTLLLKSLITSLGGDTSPKKKKPSLQNEIAPKGTFKAGEGIHHVVSALVKKTKPNISEAEAEEITQKVIHAIQENPDSGGMRGENVKTPHIGDGYDERLIIRLILSLPENEKKGDTPLASSTPTEKHMETVAPAENTSDDARALEREREVREIFQDEHFIKWIKIICKVESVDDLQHYFIEYSGDIVLKIREQLEKVPPLIKGEVEAFLNWASSSYAKDISFEKLTFLTILQRVKSGLDKTPK